MSPEIENELLEDVPLSRRGFVKKAVIGSAFAIPLITSFEMRTLGADAADCVSPNQSLVSQDSKYEVEILEDPLLPKAGDNTLELKIRVRDAQTHRNVSSPNRRVRLRKIQPQPTSGLGLPIDFKFKHDFLYGKHYLLKLDTTGWPHQPYRLKYTVAKDPTRFSVEVLVGYSCV